MYMFKVYSTQKHMYKMFYTKQNEYIYKIINTEHTPLNKYTSVRKVFNNEQNKYIRKVLNTEQTSILKSCLILNKFIYKVLCKVY